MGIDLRFVLYGLIRSRRPEYVLEVGTRHGGSAAIIAAALEDNGMGTIIGLDPAPAVTMPWRVYHGRFELIRKAAPDGLPDALAAADGQLFDFVLWDAVVVYDEVKRGVAACLPFMAEDAYLIVTNGFHYGANQAIHEIVREHENVHDCGFISSTASPRPNGLAHWGFRLLRYSRSKLALPQSYVARAYQEIGLEAPGPDPESFNCDSWYCRMVKPCPKCSRKQASE
jgi:hypothetical protein